MRTLSEPRLRDRVALKHAADRGGMAQLAGAAAVSIGGIPILALFHLGPISLHMVHHIALMNVVAPLSAVALAAPAQVVTRRSSGLFLWSAFCVQIALLWTWHAPPLHAAAMASGAAYAGMLASLFAAALCFWGSMLLISRHAHWQAIVALLATGKLSCLLGALLIFAPRLLYPIHVSSHAGPPSIEDQQLAGLLMIAACPLSYVLVGVVLSAQKIYELRSEMELMGRPSFASGLWAQ